MLKSINIIYKTINLRCLLKFFTIIFLSTLLYSQTIKDISSFVGIRSNQLIGYGVVVGLEGTGDKSEFAKQSLQNLLRNSMIKTPIMSKNSKNIAAVMVTASLPAFAKQGDKINVKISSIGDAKSLKGGQLLLTQLKAINGKIYAIAQGSINIPKTQKTIGTIYNGAVVEQEISYDLSKVKEFTLTLEKSNAKIASIIEQSINEKFDTNIAFAKDTKNIILKKPDTLSSVTFISLIESIELDIQIDKKIIIDLASKTVLVGGDIKISPATIATKDFTFRIKKYPPTPSQFDDLTNLGQDIGEDVKIDLTKTMLNTKDEPTVSNLVRAMTVMKLDIMEIVNALQKLKELGAIKAKIELR
jgi:flagellar P-ring protein precursor FlgI